MKKKVHAYGTLPSTPPLQFTAIVYLLSDKLNTSDLINGVLIALVVLTWLAYIYGIATTEQVDVLNKS